LGRGMTSLTNDVRVMILSRPGRSARFPSEAI